MLETPMFEDPWVVAGLLMIGGLVVTGLWWALGRMWGPLPRADELGALAWSAVRQVRRVFVVLAAGTLAGVGIVLLVLPGPGMLVLVAALALLATEFVWARRWILRLRESFRSLGSEARGLFQARPTGGAERSPDRGSERSPERPPRRPPEPPRD